MSADLNSVLIAAVGIIPTMTAIIIGAMQWRRMNDQEQRRELEHRSLRDQLNGQDVVLAEAKQTADITHVLVNDRHTQALTALAEAQSRVSKLESELAVLRNTFEMTMKNPKKP